MDYNLIKVTDNTVLSDAGICYFDPIDETIKEVGEGYMMGTNPNGPIIHKLFFVAKNTTVHYLKVKANQNEELIKRFDIKIQPGSSIPGIDTFNNISNYNELIIEDSIQPYSIVPFYVYIKALAPLDQITSLPLEIAYDSN